MEFMQKSNSCTTKKDGSPLSFLMFILQFSILEFPLSSSCSLEKSAKRLQIPRVKNGLLNVGTCNAYIVLFIPSFFVLPRQKCMDSNLRMYSLTKKFFVKKRETEQEAVVLCTIVYIVISRPLGSIVIGSFRTSRKWIRVKIDGTQHGRPLLLLKGNEV